MPRSRKRKPRTDRVTVARIPVTPDSPTHADLVAAAAQWLGSQCAVVITELCTGGETSGEEPDAIGWRYTQSILIECKASLTDFRVDQHKRFRQFPETGIGRFRYYLAPIGLLKVEMLPPKWGLLEVVKGKIKKTRGAEEFETHNHAHEISILLSALRRVGQAAPEGVSIRCYAMHSTNRTSLGIHTGEDLLGVSWTELSVTAG